MGLRANYSLDVQFKVPVQLETRIPRIGTLTVKLIRPTGALARCRERLGRFTDDLLGIDRHELALVLEDSTIDDHGVNIRGLCLLDQQKDGIKKRRHV